MEKAVSTYRRIASIPTPVRASLSSMRNSRFQIVSTWQQRDLERSEKVTFQNSLVFEFDGSSVDIIGEFPSTELYKELLSSFSHCGNRKAVIREVPAKDCKPSYYLEIWNKGRKITNVNLNEDDKHGAVLSDNQFASLQWSYDDSKLLYIAEKKDSKTCSFFNHKKKEDEDPGNEHLWKESWGEQLTNAHCSTICIFDIDKEKVLTYEDDIPDEVSIGQPVWLNNNNSVIFVGWKNTPYRLGLIYCPIRESKLYIFHSQSKECRVISDCNVSLRSPRVHPDGKFVYYLENQVAGPHMPCARLMAAVIPTDTKQAVQTKVIVDHVMQPISEDDFHGIYAMLIPRRCFSEDGNFLFMTTQFKSHASVISINLSTGGVETLTKFGGYEILDICDDNIIANHSTPVSPPEIVFAKIQNGHVEKWHSVIKPSQSIENMSWNVCSYVPELPNTEYPNLSCEYILFKPSSDISNNSLIMYPHGGPHSACTTTFTHSVVAMCQLGYTVAQINYRGSTGFGQNFIDSLPGRIGKQDVEDVHQVAKMLKEQGSYDRVFITGGSHGGFLTLHLISQYPDFYLAACVRNPVVNMPVMCGTSDIPDWNYCESLNVKFEADILPSAHDYSIMLSKSPISLIQNAKAPCLMMLGEEDLRCPPSQGLHWAKLYKALGKTCKVLMYKGNNHPIAKVDAEADSFINLIKWFKKHGEFQ